MEPDHAFRNFIYRAQRSVKLFPNLYLYFTGLGLSSFILAYHAFSKETKAQNEISFRKIQLSQEPVEIKDNVFPWNKDNIHDWLYRPVIITGRPIHSKTMFIPHKLDYYPGFEYVLPLVTEENEDGSIQSGVLFNKGFIPHEYHGISLFTFRLMFCYFSLYTDLFYRL